MNKRRNCGCGYGHTIGDGEACPKCGAAFVAGCFLTLIQARLLATLDEDGGIAYHQALGIAHVKGDPTIEVSIKTANDLKAKGLMGRDGRITAQGRRIAARHREATGQDQ